MHLLALEKEVEKCLFWKMKQLAVPQLPQKYFRVNNALFWGLCHSFSS